MLDRHMGAITLHVADDGHFQFGAGRQGRLAGFGGQHHRAVRGGDPQRGAQAGAGADHQGRATRGGVRAAQVQHAAGVDLRGSVGHRLEVVDDVDPLQAHIGFHLARRQRPRQVGGDHGAVLAGVAGAGDHAVRGARAFAQEVGQDRAETGVVGVAVLRYSSTCTGWAASPLAWTRATRTWVPPTSAARNEGATRDRTWAGAGWLAVTRAPAAGGAGPGSGAAIGPESVTALTTMSTSS